MTIRALPLVAGIVPVTGVFLAYWIGVDSGILPACSPFLDGCVSISATGRYLPASLVFHAVMLPQSVLLVFFWSIAAQWLRTIAPETGAAGIVVAAGILGALSLILYVTFLGTTAPFYEFMRRFGIYFYFLGTATAQVTLAIAILGHARKSGLQRLQRISVGMLWFCGLPFALGILNMVLKATLDDADQAENRIEWISALLMQAYFVLVYFAWRETGLTVSIKTR